VKNAIITILVTIVLAGVGYYVLTMPDRRTTTEKIGDAIHELPQGVDKAARQLDDRTPADKIGDQLKDASEKAKETAP
jgi:hypothetical protein